MANSMSFCFECLKQRIDSDFSDRLLVCYAISDSALPLASSAVVQMSYSDGETSPSQFTMVHLPSDDHGWFTKYVNKYIANNDECISNHGIHSAVLFEASQNEGEVSVPTPKEKTSSSDSLPNNSLFLLDVSRESCIKSSTCNHFDRLSCLRTITSLAPIAHVGVSCFPIFEEVATNYLSGSLEDHVLSSLSLMIEGKASGRDSVNFLRLLGVPTFQEHSLLGSLRHPNLVPILAMLRTPGYINLVFPTTPHTLESILHFSPNALKSEWHIRFLLYQLLSALAYIHGLGVAHGHIRPSSVLLSNSCWSWLSVCDSPTLGLNSYTRDSRCSMTRCTGGCSSQNLYADLKLSHSIDWESDFFRWWKGELSNFEYLLILNRLAGRRWGDHTFHTVMPWVIDFSTKPEENSDAGWRDLSKSKWRLAKGDEQLDFTYITSEIPHHVSDECLSELAVCSYKARRLPLSVLRMAVRSVYEPNEYPSNMQRLYQWTPDECIPEFYSDPQIFYSINDGMADLAVPQWAGTPNQFIKFHRYALESERVSSQLHHWIDITFGYKMSGEAAVSAKNVMLHSSETSVPRSVGRRQLFTRPHPRRQVSVRKSFDAPKESALHQCQVNQTECDQHHLIEATYIQELEEASVFVEHASHLSAVYGCHAEESRNSTSSVEELSIERHRRSKNKSFEIDPNRLLRGDIDLAYLLEHIEENEGSMGYQELLLWRQRSSSSLNLTEDVAKDIFSLGCVLTELYLKKPLFNSTTFPKYLENSILPGLIQELPFQTRILVEACLQKDWMRRPSAKNLLESPYFPATIKSCYLFLAPLQLLAKDGTRLRYAANFAKQGVLKAMGTFSAEMCAPYCLPLVVIPLSDAEAEWAYVLLKEFVKCLVPKAVKTLILPAIQKILQITGYSHLKVSLLQDSFVREIWNCVGKQLYLETIHPLVITNLSSSPHKSSAAAASVLLIGSSDELGVPITIHQTILPLINCFGRGICADGMDVLVRIGGLLGETFIIKQMLPLLKNVIHSCTDVLAITKPEPMQSWGSVALIDCFTTLEGLAAFLPSEVIVKELIGDQSCLHVLVLMQKNLEVSVLQVAAATLVSICQRIGPDLTALHVLPQLKDLLDELAFSQENLCRSSSLSRSMEISKPYTEVHIESRIDLALLLYPSFASLLGIEKLRQGCATWLLLEQYLFRCHNWKWEYKRELSRSGSENQNSRTALSKGSMAEYNPAKLLLNGVGWSIPQSQGTKGAKNLMPQRQFRGSLQGPTEIHMSASNLMNHEPWFWFPSPAGSWDGPEFLGRTGSLKDELPWKIRASVIHSVRAHHGVIRSMAVLPDECTVFTAGVGPGFKGTVQKWELTRVNCISDYYGHEEVVNDICVLSSSGRIASCDGTVHVWDSRTGKQISIFSEPSVDSAHVTNSLSSALRINAEHNHMINSNSLSSGILTGAFDGSLYSCMHQLEFSEVLAVGTGNGSLRFIDVAQGQRLHMWKGECIDSGFPSLVSAISSCGYDKMQTDGGSALGSWIATGLSSGRCRLFDARSGKVIASWKAHDGYVTQLASPEDHLLLSSSLDRTLRIWDLRRNVVAEPIIFKGHSDGVSGFSVWGQDVISISRNKIGVSSLSKSSDEDGQYRVVPHKLCFADQGTRNLSVLSSISILPNSRLFLVGTEDGYLRICC